MDKYDDQHIKQLLLKAETQHKGFELLVKQYESIDFVRRQKNLSIVSADDEDAHVANTLMADEYFDGDETEALLQEAIASLPEVQRTVFTLRYFDEMKYSEMSQRLKTSEGSLKASYHIAVKKISEFFKSHD